MKNSTKVLLANLTISVAFWTLVLALLAYLDGAM